MIPVKNTVFLPKTLSFQFGGEADFSNGSEICSESKSRIFVCLLQVKLLSVKFSHGESQENRIGTNNSALVI